MYGLEWGDGGGGAELCMGWSGGMEVGCRVVYGLEWGCRVVYGLEWGLLGMLEMIRSMVMGVCV